MLLILRTWAFNIFSDTFTFLQCYLDIKYQLSELLLKYFYYYFDVTAAVLASQLFTVLPADVYINTML